MKSYYGLWRAYRNSPTLFRAVPSWPPLPVDWGFSTQPKTAVACYELQILYAHSYDRSEQKPIKILATVVRRTRGLSKIFNAPIYSAHRAVIFAVAQLSCIVGCYQRVLVVGFHRRNICSQESGAVALRNARRRCKFRYVSNFTTALCGFSATAGLPCIHQRPFKCSNYQRSTYNLKKLYYLERLWKLHTVYDTVFSPPWHKITAVAQNHGT